MAKLPYPLEKSNDMPLEKYLLNIITAIVKKQGGELRLTAHEIIASVGFALSKSPTEKMDAIILRATPAGTETYFVAEAPAWTAPTSPKTRVLPTISQPTPRVETQQSDNLPKTSRSKQLDDMALFLAEQARDERISSRQEQQETQQRREAGLYPWYEDRER